MLRRALQNLITNAIRYTEKPGAEVVVAARRIGRSRVTLGVYDAGPGLTAEEKRRIFETFYRGAAGKRNPGDGFGLGLSIVKGICRQLGIDLSIGSHPGRGSVFRLGLNLDESEQVKYLEKATPPSELIERLEGAALLLEDNPFVKEALCAKLASWGAEVIAAEAWADDLLERVKDLRARRGRLILLSDYNLGDGEVTGLAAAGLLEAGLGAEIPTVLLTAVARDLIEADYRERKQSGKPVPKGMPVILQKPASDVALNAAIARAAASVEPAAISVARAEEAQPDAPGA